METPRGLDAPPASARWGLLALTVAAALVRLHGLAAEEPWFDEVFSIVASSQDLATLWRSAVADQTNPPGFYLLLWGWIQLGGLDLAWLRLLPALASTVTVPAVALAARALGLGVGAALTAAALAAASPLMLAMAHEVRTYALLALATTLTLSAVLRGHRAATVLGYLALVALHYFGALVVAALALGEVTRDPQRWRPAIAPALPAAAALATWIGLTVHAATGPVGQNASWIPAFHLTGLIDLASQVVGTFATAPGTALVCSALLAALGFALMGSRRQPALRPVLTLAVLPLLLVALADLLTQSLWVERYLIIVLPAWWLLLVAATARWRGLRAHLILLALVSWAIPAGLYGEWARPRKTAWSTIARALASPSPRGLCTNEFYVALPLRYQAVQHAIPLTILDLEGCTATGHPDGIILRPGTEATLRDLAARGAIIGTPRDLHTRSPETQFVPLDWPAARR